MLYSTHRPPRSRRPSSSSISMACQMCHKSSLHSKEPRTLGRGAYTQPLTIGQQFQKTVFCLHVPRTMTASSRRTVLDGLSSHRSLDVHNRRVAGDVNPSEKMLFFKPSLQPPRGRDSSKAWLVMAALLVQHQPNLEPSRHRGILRNFAPFVGRHEYQNIRCRK